MGSTSSRCKWSRAHHAAMHSLQSQRSSRRCRDWVSVLEGVGSKRQTLQSRVQHMQAKSKKGLDRLASARLESLIRLPIMYEEAQAVCEGAFAIHPRVWQCCSCTLRSTKRYLHAGGVVPLTHNAVRQRLGRHEGQGQGH